jgi:SAM-dependent methyltransferase
MIRALLAHPLTRGMDIDSPETTGLRREIIREKHFLRRIYQEWYTALAVAIPDGEGDVLELGSGAGFLRDYIPGLITSDVLPLAGIDRVVDALHLPFADASLRAIVMTNVLHHLPDPRRFLAEAARCIRPEGAIVMIEPWNTPWSHFVYRTLHHEPFEPNAPHWQCAGSGPLSSANGALPWIMFARDRAHFEHTFPEWSITAVEPLMPFRYLLSGGVSLRNLVPSWTYGLCRWVEERMGRWRNHFAMFAKIVLTRRDHCATAVNPLPRSRS